IAQLAQDMRAIAARALSGTAAPEAHMISAGIGLRPRKPVPKGGRTTCVCRNARVSPVEEMGMDDTGPTPDEAEDAFLSWLGFWVQFLLLGLLALIGAFFASADERTG